MLRFIVLSLTLLVLLPAPLWAADDPGGWDKAKWGMTPEQVQKAYPGGRQVGHFYYLQGITIESGIPNGRASFWFGDKEGLRGVTLSLVSAQGDIQQFSPAQLSAIKALLIQRYGSPNQIMDLWQMGNTQVSLSRNDIRYTKVVPP